MTNNQLTDERIKELMHIGRYSYHVVCGREIADICTALEELQERRKAERDSEPVAFTDERNLGYIDRGRETAYLWGKQNSEAGDVPLYRHAQQPVVPPMQHWEELCREYPDMSIGDAIIRAAWWNHCRAAMLQSGNSPAQNPGWIPVSERLPEVGGRYWCYVEEQNSLGKSHYQWNCSWNGEIWGGAMMYGRVTHWMPLPAAPQEMMKDEANNLSQK